MTDDAATPLDKLSEALGECVVALSVDGVYDEATDDWYLHVPVAWLRTLAETLGIAHDGFAAAGMRHGAGWQSLTAWATGVEDATTALRPLVLGVLDATEWRTFDEVMAALRIDPADPAAGVAVAVVLTALRRDGAVVADLDGKYRKLPLGT